MTKKLVKEGPVIKQENASDKDVFYSEANQKCLRKSIQQLENGNGKIHKLKQ